MVSDPYLFSENASEIANGSYGRNSSDGAGTRHFRTAPNISSFDRNATPERDDDESAHPGTGSRINLFISMAYENYSLPSKSRTSSTTKITPPSPMPEWPMP